jgi:hypothetical protein
MVNLPSENDYITEWVIIDIGAVQRVWRMLKRAGFDYLQT